MINRRTLIKGIPYVASGLALPLRAPAAAASPGVTATEIKLGQTMPYSGPAAGYSIMGKVEVAFFEALSEAGGINGRKVILLSADDGYSPPKTAEETRRLVEQEGVLAIFSPLGTPTVAAIQKYLTNKKVALLLSSGASRWNQPKLYPLTIPIYTSYRFEARAYAKYILTERPDAKIAVLYQNDDFGKDFLGGLEEGLGPRAKSMIVKEASYEVTDPTVDSQLIELKASGADTLFDIATLRATAQAIKRTRNLDWKPLHIIYSADAGIDDVLKPAGLDASTGLISAIVQKDPSDPTWADDTQVRDYLAFMHRKLPNADPANPLAVVGYILANIMAQILRQCGEELTTENIVIQATRLQDYDVPMLLPGIRLDLQPADYAGIRSMRLQQFDGHRWVPFGDIVHG